MREPISRRLLLASTALGLGVAAAAIALSEAEAEQNSQDVAKYQAKPNGAQHCALCVNFQPPNACKFVQGDISPDGWCQLFSQKT